MKKIRRNKNLNYRAKIKAGKVSKKVMVSIKKNRKMKKSVAECEKLYCDLFDEQAKFELDVAVKEEEKKLKAVQ